MAFIHAGFLPGKGIGHTMISDGSSDIVLFVLITGRKQKEAILTALPGVGVKMMNTVYAKGSVKSGGYLWDMLGFIPEENKVMISCLILNEKTDAVMDMLVNEFGFNKPNTGIAFTIPVESL